MLDNTTDSFVFIDIVNLLLLTTNKTILLDTGISKTWGRDCMMFRECICNFFESTTRIHFFTFLGIQYRPLTGYSQPDTDGTDTVAASGIHFFKGFPLS